MLAAGCGGGRLSHGDFVKRADAVCSAYNARVKPRVITPRSYDAIERYVDGTLPLYMAALQKLSALQPPSSDVQAARTWLAADRRVARAVRALGVAAQQRNFPAVSAAASRAQLAASESRQAAAGLGMRVCGTLTGV
ncbi:MAG TPA: hypothetical protein VGH82_15280 [Gaiellaceae bacterium]|jgi:hypothetical protein